MSKNTKKNSGFTVTSNHPLRDPNLSNAARGLLCTMKSLPPNWNFTIRGLAVICHDGVDAIRSQISELEKFGYLIRTRKRDERGHFTEMEYQIVDSPIMVFPTQVAPVEGNPTEINKDQQIWMMRNITKNLQAVDQHPMPAKHSLGIAALYPLEHLYTPIDIGLNFCICLGGAVLQIRQNASLKISSNLLGVSNNLAIKDPDKFLAVKLPIKIG